MELKEMIKVMQHYEDGGEVEYSEDYFQTILGTANKKKAGDLFWDWFSLKYRIKEQKQKVTIEKWLCQNKDGDYTVIETPNIEEFIYHKKVKLFESYEIEL